VPSNQVSKADVGFPLKFTPHSMRGGNDGENRRGEDLCFSNESAAFREVTSHRVAETGDSALPLDGPLWQEPLTAFRGSCLLLSPEFFSSFVLHSSIPGFH
jgi:hypothetical protein